MALMAACFELHYAFLSFTWYFTGEGFEKATAVKALEIN